MSLPHRREQSGLSAAICVISRPLLRGVVDVSSLLSRGQRGTAVAAVVLLLLLPAGWHAAAARPGPEGFADLAARLVPSVVNISTTETVRSEGQGETPEHGKSPFPPGSPFDQFFKNFFNHNAEHGSDPGLDLRKATSLGSGFIIDPSGYVVTNNHVIENADTITVILHDNTDLAATVVGRDAKTDIAVLKVNAKEPLIAAAWGDSDKARVGDWVLAIGNPFGLGGSVTAGILSARQRDINAGPYDDFLQTDAPINRGNSGGPMFNMDGRVIGINTAIFSPSGGSIGIGFAIPSNLAREIVDELMHEPDHTVHRGWLGVRIQSVTGEIAESLGLDKAAGALVASVNAGGPAQKSGIEPGDVILTYAGKPVPDLRQLPRLVAESRAGSTVPVTIWRKRRKEVLQVVVGRLTDSPKVAANKPSATDSVMTLGLTLSNITPALKSKFSLGNDKGVVVVSVLKDSPAAAKGLQPGDVIIEASQEDIASARDILSKIDAARRAGRKSILLLVERQGDLRFVALRLDQS
jgi:serine protease Do